MAYQITVNLRSQVSTHKIRVWNIRRGPNLIVLHVGDAEVLR